jgi:hypothetical protein
VSTSQLAYVDSQYSDQVAIEVTVEDLETINKNADAVNVSNRFI